MKIQDSDDIFGKRAREVFVSSTAGLDEAVLKRLREARRLAVEAVGKPAPFWQLRPWALPAGAVAALFVAVLGGVQYLNGPAPAQSPPFASNGEDSGLLLANDNLDMYSDLEFYRWLATEEQKPAATPNPDEEDSDPDQGDDSDTGG
jgi:hypothetical protein